MTVAAAESPSIVLNDLYLIERTIQHKLIASMKWVGLSESRLMSEVALS